MIQRSPSPERSRGEEVRRVEHFGSGRSERGARGGLQHAAQQLKREPGGGLFVGGVTLPLALAGLGLIDEYEFVVHPVVAGHGPTLFDGLGERLEQSSWGARSSGRGRWHCATSPVERRLEGRPPVRADLATPRQRRG